MQWKRETLEYKRDEEKVESELLFQSPTQDSLRKWQLGEDLTINNPRTKQLGTAGTLSEIGLAMKFLAFKICLSHECACEIPQGGSRS